MLVLNEREFLRAVSFVRDNYGINLEKKYALVQARLALDIEHKGYSSFAEYFDVVFANPHGAESQSMIDKISTNHTFFFREPRCFEHMKNVAVPAFVRQGIRHICIWSAASSSGQECYTIAMILDDLLKSRYGGVSFSILGTDVNSVVLKTAAEGIYPAAEIQKIPPSFQKRYCVRRQDGDYEISPALKSLISWKKVNLIEPLRGIFRYHLLFCRNVMIYFDAATKEDLAKRLHKAIFNDGYLYLGSTETVDPARKYFTYISPSVFARKQASADEKR